MAESESSQQVQPDPVQPPTEGGEGIAEVEGADALHEREDHAEEGAGQEGRGRIQ